jgi:peptide/nickel transport system permease protein
VRAEALSLRSREYVQAMIAMGGGSRRAIVRHIIPNVIGTVVVNATFQVADAIMLVAYLSFLGLGVPLPKTDWGGMLAGGLNYAFDGYWWMIIPPGAAIVLVVCAFNFIGDGLRDAFEVRLRDR